MEIINLTASPAAAMESAKEVTGSRSKDAFDPALAGMRALAPPGKEPPPIPPQSAVKGEEGAKVEPNAPTQTPDFSPENEQATRDADASFLSNDPYFDVAANASASVDAAAVQAMAQMGSILVPGDGSERTGEPHAGGASTEAVAFDAARAPNDASIREGADRSEFAPQPFPGQNAATDISDEIPTERPRARTAEEFKAPPTPMPVQLPRQDVARGPRQDVARELPHDATTGPRNDVAREPRQDVAREPRQDVARELRQDVARESRQDEARGPRQDIAREMPQDTGRLAAKVGQPWDKEEHAAPVTTIELEGEQPRIDLKDLSVGSLAPKPKEDAEFQKPLDEGLADILADTSSPPQTSNDRFGANGERRDHWDKPLFVGKDQSDEVPVQPEPKPVASVTIAAPVAQKSGPAEVETSKPDLTATQKEAVLHQVADRIESLMASRTPRKVTVHLDPRDFGSITLVVRQSGREVDAEVYASNETVRQALDSGQKLLQNGLEQKGIQLGSMTVGGELSQGSGRQEQAMRDAASQQRQFLPPPPREATRHSLEATGAFYAHTAKGIDLWI